MALATLRHQSMKQQRLQSLRADLALKEQELSEVRARLAELGRNKPAATVDFLDRACKVRNVLHQVPLAQVGNVTALFKTATTEEVEKQRLLKKTISEIELQARQANETHRREVAEFEAIAEKTGYTTSILSPAAKAEIPEEDEFEMRTVIDRMKNNIAASEVVLKRKMQVAAQLSEELEKRADLQLRVDQEANAVLVVEREINEKKEILRALLERHALLDQEIDAAQAKVDQESAALLQLDIVAYKQRSAEVVEQRRAEDRVMKAQEARIATLDRRLEMLRTVLASHDLLEPVEARVHELCSKADTQRLASVSASDRSRSTSASTKHQDPTADPPAASPSTEDGDGNSAPKTMEDIVAKYSDVDVLVPEYEMLPSSILSLFQHDLSVLERSLRIKETMVHEKEDVKLALIAKVKDLQVQHEDLVDRLHDVKDTNEAELDERVETARGVLDAKKEDFDALVKENAKLNHRIRSLEKRASASPSRSQSAAQPGDKDDEGDGKNRTDDGDAAAAAGADGDDEKKKPAPKKGGKKQPDEKKDDVQSGW